jgi:hypothetical protein
MIQARWQSSTSQFSQIWLSKNERKKEKKNLVLFFNVMVQTRWQSSKTQLSKIWLLKK